VRRYKIASVLSIIAMPVIAVATGTWFAMQPGWSLFRAIAYGTMLGVFAPLLWWAAYRTWARIWCGAPFSIDDHVRVATGAHAGCIGRITRVHQGLEVDVELPGSGDTTHETYSWGELRRVRSMDGVANAG
jgi:flagellar biosynthesis protein FliR